MNLLALKWTAEWPTKSGTYLYYGDFKSEQWKPEFLICVVAKASNGVVTYAAGGHWLYPHEQRGVFACFDVEEPDVAAVLNTTQER